MSTLTAQLHMELGLKKGALYIPAEFAKKRPAQVLVSLCHLSNINPLKVIYADWQAACLVVQQYANQLKDFDNPIISLSVNL